MSNGIEKLEEVRQYIQDNHSEMPYWLYSNLTDIVDKTSEVLEAELKAKDERIATLEAMAQKMKCCMNCDGQGDREDNYYCFFADCDNLSLWRLKDNK